MEPNVVIALSVTETVAELFQAHDMTPCQAFQTAGGVRIAGRSFRSATRTFPMNDLPVKFIPLSRVLSSPSSPPIIPPVSDAAFDKGIVVRCDDAGDPVESDPTPWFTQFVDDLNDALMFNPLRFTEEPLCCVCIASEDEADPIAAFTEQRDEVVHLPNLFTDLSPDTALPIHLVLLSDAALSGDRSRPIFETMQTVFHPSICSELPLDYSALSSTAADACSYPAINSFVFDLLTLTVVPDLEYRIRSLHSSVSHIRKGFRNQLKNLFGAKRPPKPDFVGGFNPAAPAELQTRQLADYAFLAGDLPLALEHYRLFAADCRGKDRLRAELALADTGIAITGAMILSRGEPNQPPVHPEEMTSCLDVATHYYMSVGDVAGAARVASLTGLLARILPNLSRLAAALLLRVASMDNSQLGAILLEQTALAFMSSRPPLCRQYAFHLIRAGHIYQKLQLRSHSIRCYRDAFSIYQGRSWVHIEDHIRFKLGRSLFNLGDLSTSLSHYVSLVAAGRQRQDTFLNEFALVARKASDRTHCLQLELPQISVDEVVLGDRFSLPDAISDEIWRQPHLYLQHDLWSSWELCFWSQGVPAGDLITVLCTLRNPLQLPVDVTRLRLHCRIDHDDDNLAMDAVVVSEEDVFLSASQELTVKLSASCRVAGRLHILGFRWTILDTIQATAPLMYSPIDISIPSQLNRIKRWMQSGARRSAFQSVPRPLHLQIGALDVALPRVSIKFAEFPSQLLLGEICSLLLQVVVDGGHGPALDPQFQISHPNSMRLLDPNLELHPGMNEVAVLLYASSAGSCRHRVLLRYATGAKASPRHRITFVTHDVVVSPSLHIDLSVRLASEMIHHRILDIAVENRTTNTFSIERIVLHNRQEARYALEDMGLLTRTAAAGQTISILARMTPTTVASSDIVFGEFPSQYSWAESVSHRGRSSRLHLYWRIPTQDRWGIVGRPLDLLGAITDATDCPLRVTVDFPPQLDHDFTTSIIAHVPVDIVVANATSAPVVFDLECLEPDTIIDSSSQQFRTVSSSCSAGRFFWSGRTRRKGIRLGARSSLSLSLEATFMQAGVFSLNHFKLVVEAAPPRLFFFPIQRLVRVIQTPVVDDHLLLT